MHVSVVRVKVSYACNKQQVDNNGRNGLALRTHKLIRMYYLMLTIMLSPVYLLMSHKELWPV